MSAGADKMMRRMELLEQRILSPPVRNDKISISSPSGEDATFHDIVIPLTTREESRRGFDDTICIYQNTGSQHSFSFDKSVRELPLDSNSGAHWSHAPSQSLRQANQIIDDHLRIVSQKLLIPSSTGTTNASLQVCSFGMQADNKYEDGELNHTLESNNKPISSNSLPSSVSATIMSSASMASHQTLVTAHIDHRTSIISHLPSTGNLPASNGVSGLAVEGSSLPMTTDMSLQEDSQHVSPNDLNAPPHVSRVYTNLPSAVSGLSNKRKSITPNKRTLTSITDLSTQSEVNKKYCSNSNPAVEESRKLSGIENLDPLSCNDIYVRVANGIHQDRAATPSIIEHGTSSRGSVSNTPFVTSTSIAVKKPAVKATINNNNAVITSFFTKASEKNESLKVSGKNTLKPAAENGELKLSSSNQITPSISDERISSIERENSSLKAQIIALQASLKDAKDQLNAVSNNQTIVHTHLRAQVVQCEKTITRLQDEIKDRSMRNMNVVEFLIRKQCTKEQVELRQQLASDGARLGRLVFNRVGMHSVESWEDGMISKTLKKKKEDLRKQKDLLLKKKLDQTVNQEKSDPDLFEKDIFLESLEMQIENIQKQEAVIEKEEGDVYLEKASHIKALKRLASEDASRFNSRPKMNDRYIPMSLLGKGGFSEVWLAYDLIELREVAMKIHQLDPRWSEAKIENYTKHVAREYEIHRDVRHPRIVSLYDVFEIDNNSFATVLEYCKGTDLDTLLKERKFLPERRARLILLQILSGMKYLSTPSADKSRQGIIHYDLKPGNILFDENGDAKITDFGLSKILDSQDPAGSMELTSQGAGTYWYLPPECFLMDECVKISNKVDVWSIGVIFYQMLFGKRPFGDGLSQDKVLSNSLILKAKEVRFPQSPSVSEGSRQFIQSCLTYEQHDRPTIADISKHPYITGAQVDISSNISTL